MLRAVLRNLERPVGGIHYTLLHPLDLVAEHKGIAFEGSGGEVLQLGCVLRLLHAQDRVALLPELTHQGLRIGAVLPGHAVLRPEGRLVDFSRRRAGTDAAKPYFIDLESVGGTEGAADVVRASDVVKYKYHTGLGQAPILLRADPAEFDI